MRTISVINLKGGVGKTTTVINLAAILTGIGKSVLAIDADPQANLTEFCGFRDPDKTLDNTLAELLTPTAEGRSDYAEDYVRPTLLTGLDLVPASINLINADIAALKRGGNVNAIRDLLDNLNEDAWIEGGVPEDFAGAYDYVLIDCPPSFTAASVAAIYASDDVIIPVEADLFSIIGLTSLIAQINSVRRIQPRVRVAGALITKWHNTPACVQGECALRASAVPVFAQTIRRSDKVTESIFARQSLQAYSPQSAAGRDYRAFVAEYLEGGEISGEEVRARRHARRGAESVRA